MSPDQWQQRLHDHFSRLASLRSALDSPLFALEHGLAEGDLDEITTLLHDQLTDGWKLGRCWLLWVVYAAELGYDYDGGEYWQTFEDNTPGWRQPITATRRNQLRSWFTRFHTTYHGVRPSGAWADQFPIIAWPVTHAVLPRYLQWHLARALYELRYQLAHLTTLSPIVVGRLLAANAWESSSRFREFLKQAELAGRIVLALLDDRALEEEGPIYPPTLTRLTSDLEEVQSSREWLNEARTLITERLRGTARSNLTSGGRHDSSEGQPRTLLRLRPTLTLRPSRLGSPWSILIEIPSLAEAGRCDPALHALLRKTRCKIAGTGDTWHPASWLLSGERTPVLKSWPGSGQPLAQFEQSNPALEQFAQMQMRLATGPVWLCRIAPDGRGREVVGRIARPGRRYVLLSEIPIKPGDFITSCNVDCQGIHAAMLELPARVSADGVTRLQQLGLHIARTVRIFPVGLSARRFDGEGQSEWLTTESPCFGIVHDHAVSSYSLQLDGESETIIGAPAANTPIFVRIGRLPAGRHTLMVRAHSAIANLGAASWDGVITLDVREPEPWTRGSTSHSGMAVSIEPTDPTMDDLWDGDFSLSILGPVGHQLTAEIQLFNPGGKELLVKRIATFALPVTPPEWTGRFSSITDDEALAWPYAEATTAKIRIRGDELGEYVLRLERDSKPLRWACRNQHKTTTVRLIDDTGAEDAPRCQFLSFRDPIAALQLEPVVVLQGLNVESPGGIFRAELGKFEDDIVVSIPTSGRGFADLLIDPDLSALEGDAISTITLINTVRLWSHTRLLGPLAAMRRNRILERLANKLYARLCGHRWAAGEAAFLANPHSPYACQKLRDLVSDAHGLGVALTREFDRMHATAETGVAWFFTVVSRYRVSADQGLTEFALRLAASPQELPRLAPTASVLNGLLEDIRRNDGLLRAARLVALLSGSTSPGPYGATFPRWTW